MNLSILLRVKRGQVGPDELLKWILYGVIIAAAIFGVRRIFHVFNG